MTRALKSSFLWQFAGGFVLGSIGLVALQPGEIGRNLERHLHGPAPVAATR